MKHSGNVVSEQIKLYLKAPQSKETDEVKIGVLLTLM